MCNLSEWIEGEALEHGIEIGEAMLILTMHKKGCTVEQIADLVDKTVEEIPAIIEKKGLLPV